MLLKMLIVWCRDAGIAGEPGARLLPSSTRIAYFYQLIIIRSPGGCARGFAYTPSSSSVGAWRNHTSSTVNHCVAQRRWGCWRTWSTSPSPRTPSTPSPPRSPRVAYTCVILLLLLVVCEYVCMYVCMYVSVYVYIYIFTYIYIYIYMCGAGLSGPPR